MKNLNQLIDSNDALSQKAKLYLKLVDTCTSPAAVQQASALRYALDDSSVAINTAVGHSKLREAAVQRARSTEDALGRAVGGAYAMIEVDDPALFAKLPALNGVQLLPVKQQAVHLMEVLQAAGPAGAGYDATLTKVFAQWSAADAALTETGLSTDQVEASDISLAKLKVAVQQTDVFLRTEIKPGDPRHPAFMEARTNGAVAKAKATREKKASDQKPKPAPKPAASSAAPATQPTSTPAIQVPAATSGGASAPVLNGSAPAVLNGAAPALNGAAPALNGIHA